MHAGGHGPHTFERCRKCDCSEPLPACDVAMKSGTEESVGFFESESEKIFRVVSEVNDGTFSSNSHKSAMRPSPGFGAATPSTR
jgi:hypothetical protein